MQQTAPTTQTTWESSPPGPNYATRQAIGVGIAQIVIGVLSTIAAVVEIILHTYNSSTGTGFWCAIFYVIAGALGVASGRNTTKGLVIGCMVMSIIAAVTSLVQLTYGSTVANEAASYKTAYSSYTSIYYRTTTASPTAVAISTRRGLGIAHVILALVEVGAAIWQSVLTCMNCCRGSSKDPSPPQVFTTAAPNQAMGGSVVSIPGTGQVLFTSGATSAPLVAYPPAPHAVNQSFQSFQVQTPTTAAVPPPYSATYGMQPSAPPMIVPEAVHQFGAPNPHQYAYPTVAPASVMILQAPTHVHQPVAVTAGGGGGVGRAAGRFVGDVARNVAVDAISGAISGAFT